MDLQHDSMNQIEGEEVNLYLLIIVSQEISNDPSLLEACLRRGIMSGRLTITSLIHPILIQLIFKAYQMFVFLYP